MAADLTQEALAERAGLSVDAISTLESGRRLRPHPSTVTMLADGLELGGEEREEFVAAARLRRPATSSIGNASGRGLTSTVPQRVFLSHTSDLGKHTEPGTFVAAAVGAVLRARHAVTDMAYFAARDTSPAATCFDMVAQSDVYVGIIGLRYGSPVRDRPDLAYTELEFETAGRHGQPRLIFLIREDSVHLSPADEAPAHQARQNAFRRRLRDSGLTVVRVSSPSELGLALYQALMELAPVPDAPMRLADAQGLLAAMPTVVLPQRAPLPPGSRMPLAPNPLFVGRGEELLQVATALRGGGTTVALGQVVASTGLGGLGKTQLAVELVHRYGRYFAGGVFWLSFGSADEIPLQVAACVDPDYEARPLEERVQRVKDAWQSAVPRLLVFDNCEEEVLLESWRPTSGGCRVLVTSRRSHWSPTLGVTVLPLDLLPRPDSIELLRRYRSDLAPNDPGLDAVAHELGDLPLALHLGGSYLRAYSVEVSLAAYLAELQHSDVVQHASLLGAGVDDAVSPTRHVHNVAQTFAICLRRLDREREVDRVALALLARMACMAPGEPVPLDLLAKTLEEVGPLRRADGLRRLGAVGLVEEGEGWLRLHRLLAHFVRQENLDPPARLAVVRTLIECGEAARQGDLSGEALAAIASHTVDLASGDASHASERAGVYAATGLTLRYAGDLRAARPWLERALTTTERVLGSEHPATARALDDLGELLHARDELAAAQSLFERALAIRERILGPEHPDTGDSLNLVGMLLAAQGDVAAARPLYERSLAVWEKAGGPEHPDTGRVLHNLALVLREQGELSTARLSLERALAIFYRALGSDHRDTATALHSLGCLRRAVGELAGARPQLERALAIRERALGPDHRRTVDTLHELAGLLRDQDEPAAARALFERALAIRERVLGPDHPDTVATRRALEELAAEGGGAEAGK